MSEEREVYFFRCLECGYKTNSDDHILAHCTSYSHQNCVRVVDYETKISSMTDSYSPIQTEKEHDADKRSDIMNFGDVIMQKWQIALALKNCGEMVEEKKDKGGLMKQSFHMQSQHVLESLYWDIASYTQKKKKQLLDVNVAELKKLLEEANQGTTEQYWV